jgi:hypothetical protein
MRIKLKDGSILNAPDGLTKVEYRDLLLKERPDLYSISSNPLDVAGDAVERFAGQSKAALTDVLPAIYNKVVGDEDAYKAQMGEYAQKLQDLELSAPRRYDDYTQTTSLTDKALYGLETLAETVPQIGVQIGAAGLGALTGSLIGPGGTVAGGATGAAVASAIMNSPEILNAVTNPETGEVDLKAGALALAGVTALDMVGVGKIGGPVFKKMVLGKALEKVGMETGDEFLMRSAKGFLRGALAEAPTEAAQQAITLQAENYVRQNGDLFTEANLTKILDSGIRGGLGGGVAGGAIDATMGQRPPNPFKDTAQAESEFSSALSGAMEVLPQIKELQDSLDERNSLEAGINQQRQNDQLAAEIRMIQIQRENERQRLINAEQVQMPIDGGNPDVIRPGYAASVSTEEGSKLAPIPAVDMGFKEPRDKQGDLFKERHQLKNFNNQEAYIPEALLKQEQRKVDNAAKNATMNAGREAKRLARVAEQTRKQESIRLQQEAFANAQKMAVETATKAREVTLPPAIEISKLKPVDKTFLATKGIDVTGESIPVSEIREKVSSETADRLAKQTNTKTKFSVSAKPQEDVIEAATPAEQKAISEMSTDEVAGKIKDLQTRYERHVRDIDEKHIKPVEAKHGDVGKQWADSLREAIGSKKYDRQKLAKAFAISHLLNTLPSKSDYGFKLVDSIKATADEREAIAKSGGNPDSEAQGAYQPMSNGAIKGLFKISLSDNIDDAVDESTAHEFFHGIQDYLKTADPKAAKALNTELGSERDTVSVEDFSPQVQKLLKSMKDSKGRNAFEKMKARGKISGDEAQAYTYGAYAHALLSGQKVGVMKPGLTRAFNFVSDFRKRTKNWAKGAGFQTAEDVFSEVVTGKVAKKAAGEQKPDTAGEKKFSVRKLEFRKGDEIKIGENPTRAEVEGMLRSSKQKLLRGLEHEDGTVYVWDAADAVHEDIADMVGADYDVNDNRSDLLDKSFFISSIDDWKFRENNRRKRKFSTNANQDGKDPETVGGGTPEEAPRAVEAPATGEVQAEPAVDSDVVKSGISSFSFPAFAVANPGKVSSVVESTSFIRDTFAKYVTDPGFNSKRTGTGYNWGFLDDWITAMTNHFRPVEKLVMSIEQARGAKVKDAENPVNAEVRYHGKAGVGLKDAQLHEFKPILQFLKKNNIDWKSFDEYLYAKHAKERNAYLTAKGSKAVDPSGMSDKDAAALIKQHETPEMKQAAKMVYDLIAKTNKIRVAAGLLPKSFLNPKAYNTANPKEQIPDYNNYVPLRGWEEDPEVDEDNTQRMHTGSGFSISGKEDKNATGRTSLAADILANVFLQHSEAIIRAEKNKVGQAMLQLAQNGMPGVRINIPDVKPVVVNGVIRYRAQMPSTMSRDRVFATKKDGKLYLMEFDDPHLAKALNNSGRESMNPVFQLMSKLNRYLASVNTAWSPEFVISNFARDIQTALLNLSQYDQDVLKKDVLMDTKKAFNAIAHAEGAQFWMKTIARAKDEKWDKLYKEFLEDGASTEFLGLNTLDQIKDEMQGMIADHNNTGGVQTAKRLLGKVGDFLERHNQAVENATRLSVYANMRKAGATREKAAEIAREITINFNRKGTYGPIMNSAYLFYNAAVQGNAAFIKGAFRSKKFRKVLGMMMVAGMMNDMMNRMLAGEDEKGENLWDKLPDYIKERNFVVMNPTTGKPLFMFPMPYGFNAVWNAGVNMGALVTGGKKPFEAVQTIGSGVLNAFNPLGQGDLLTLVSPTLLDPWVEHAKNEDWSGKPIYPKDSPFGAPEPDAYKFWNNTGAIPKGISDTLNKLTGGTDARSGLVDVSPETLTYIFDYVTGAAGALVGRTAGLIEKMATGNIADIEVKDLPGIRKLFTAIPKNVDQIEYIEMRDDVMTAKAAVDQARKERNPEKIRSVLAEEKTKLGVVSVFQRIDRRLSDLRTQIKNIDYNKAIPGTIKAERKKAIREQMEKLRMQAMKAYLRRVPEGVAA